MNDKLVVINRLVNLGYDEVSATRVFDYYELVGKSKDLLSYIEVKESLSAKNFNVNTDNYDK